MLLLQGNKPGKLPPKRDGEKITETLNYKGEMYGGLLVYEKTSQKKQNQIILTD